MIATSLQTVRTWQALGALVALLVVLPIHASAESSLALRGDELQVALVHDASDGQLDYFDMLSAALVAGGVADLDELEQYRQILEARYATLDSHSPSPSELFDLLHRELLTGEYHVEYTALERTLDEGHFNCVSATILYHWLCEQSGVSSTILARREHVFVQLNGTPPRTVEPTSPAGYDGPVAASEDHHRTISFVELLGKVFYNRALAELAEGHFSSAVALFKHSLVLDPLDQSAEENLLATYNNWSLAEAEAGHFESAVRILIEGQQLDDEYAPLLANDLHVHQSWVLELCHQNRYREAIDLLDAALKRRGPAPLFDEGRFAVYQLWAEALLTEGRAAEARQVLAEGRDRHGADPRWAAYEAALHTPAG